MDIEKVIKFLDNAEVFFSVVNRVSVESAFERLSISECMDHSKDKRYITFKLSFRFPNGELPMSIKIKLYKASQPIKSLSIIYNTTNEQIQQAMGIIIHELLSKAAAVSVSRLQTMQQTLKSLIDYISYDPSRFK